jgi:hypothetical protein
MDDPLELAALILIWTAVVPSLFRSVQDMVLGNRSSRVILTLVGTGSLFLVFAGGSAFSSYTDYKMKQLMIKTNQNSIATLTSAYATELKNFPPETTLRQRSEASIAIASIIEKRSQYARWSCFCKLGFSSKDVARLSHLLLLVTLGEPNHFSRVVLWPPPTEVG